MLEHLIDTQSNHHNPENQKQCNTIDKKRRQLEPQSYHDRLDKVGSVVKCNVHRDQEIYNPHWVVLSMLDSGFHICIPCWKKLLTNENVSTNLGLVLYELWVWGMFNWSIGTFRVRYFSISSACLSHSFWAYTVKISDSDRRIILCILVLICFYWNENKNEKSL